jgi:hypothetical protein
MLKCQRNALYNYFKQTKILFFSFTKLENREVDPIPGGLIPMQRGRTWGKGVEG